MNQYEEEDVAFTITPKGIASLALRRCGLVQDYDDPRKEGFWALFQSAMKEHGYVEE